MIGHRRRSQPFVVSGSMLAAATMAPDATAGPPAPRAHGTPAINFAAIRVALGLLAVVALIGANAFFVAAEFSAVSVQRGPLKEAATSDRRARRRSARSLLKVTERLTFHLSAAQLGITVMSLLLGWVAEPLIAELLLGAFGSVLSESSAHAAAIAVALALATVVHLVAGEQLPKMLAISRPLATGLRCARPLRLYGYLMWPFVTLFNGTADRIVRLAGLEPTDELRSVRTLRELEHIIRSSGTSGELDPEDVTLLTRSIRFGAKTAADALVPRVEVITVGADDTMADLVDATARSGHSRFPVVEADLDDVRGVVHVKTVHRVPPADRHRVTVGEMMVDVWAVPESADLRSLLSEMSRRRQSLAVVVDEHGGATGIITAEDITEEIVGEIDDEHDPVAELTPPAPPGVWLLGGDLRADGVEEACGLRLAGGPYETLAGFALYHLGRIPVVGDSFTWDGWSFEVAEMVRRRIVMVRVAGRGERRP
ncbi:MAG: hemolysin family protein [bacterium]|nr:hemolysin family protein [bacterium]